MANPGSPAELDAGKRSRRPVTTTPRIIIEEEVAEAAQVTAGIAQEQEAAEDQAAAAAWARESIGTRDGDAAVLAAKERHRKRASHRAASAVTNEVRVETINRLSAIPRDVFDDEFGWDAKKATYWDDRPDLLGHAQGDTAAAWFGASWCHQDQRARGGCCSGWWCVGGHCPELDGGLREQGRGLQQMLLGPQLQGHRPTRITRLRHMSGLLPILVIVEDQGTRLHSIFWWPFTPSSGRTTTQKPLPSRCLLPRSTSTRSVEQRDRR